MSADNAIFVQKREDGAWVAQEGSMSSDEPPNPEFAHAEEVFDTLENLVFAFAEKSQETEYGFRFPNLSNFGFRATEKDLRDQGSPPHIPQSQ